MAQGVERKKEEVIEALRPYFQLGCSVLKACAYGGVPQSTVQTWINDDPDLRVRIVAWQNEIAAKARANWRAKVAQQDYAASKEWLQANERDEFGTKATVTHEGEVGLNFSKELGERMKKYEPSLSDTEQTDEAPVAPSDVGAVEV